MRLGEGVEWALHACTVLAMLPDEQTLPAARLAEFHGVPGPYFAKQLQAMANAGIVVSEPGRRGGYRLAKPPGAITLLEVIDAIEGAERSFRCTEIRQRGPAALEPAMYRKPCGIARAMWRADEAWRAALAEQTVADLLRGLARDVRPEAAMKTAAWYQEVSR